MTRFVELIGPANNPLIKRYKLFHVGRLPRLYLHHFCRSDYDRALHNHPWWFVSILLKGDYYEYLNNEHVMHRTAPSVVFRGLERSHRIELPVYLDNDYAVREKPCWTLFITGPPVRPWGFFCKDGWKHHRGFTGCPE